MKSFSVQETKKIKGVAILLLIFHHMYRTIDDIYARNASPLIFSNEGISKIAFCFRICVYIFAFLTAFGLSEKIKKGLQYGYVEFVIIRYLKLIAPYCFTLVGIWICYYVAYNQSPLTHYGNCMFMVAEFFSILELIGHTESMLFGLFWYMNFAVIEIIVVPILFELCKKIGWYILVLLSLFYTVLPTICDSIYGGNYNNYIFIIALGVLFSQNCVFDKIYFAIEKIDGLRKILFAIFLIIITYICPYIAWFVLQKDTFGIKYICHSLGALSLILFLFLFTNNQLVGRVLELFGNVSSDIFLIHIMVYELAYRIVSYTTLIPIQFITSVLISLFIAYVILFLKKISGYNKIIELMTSKLESYFKNK